MTDKEIHPPSPTVPASEPERKKQVAREALKKASEGGITVISLPAATQYLAKNDLMLDSEGFIRHKESNDYATPYLFDANAFREIDSPVDNVFQEYFTPLPDQPAYDNPEAEEKLHLTELLTIFKDEDGTPHPVKDGLFESEDLYKKTGLLYTTVTAWSDVYNRFGFGEGLNELKSLWVNTYGMEDAPELTLNCLNPECETTAPYEKWDGEENDPECPNCGGEWLETITRCTDCGEWHWGLNMDGGGMYAMPVCPHCNAESEDLETIFRY